MGTTRPAFRYFILPISFLVLMASPMLFVSVAQAATNNSVSFNKSWTFKSAPLDICILFNVSGTIQYSTTIGRNEVTYTNQKLTNPTLNANVHFYAGGSCIGPATVTGISLGQNWTGYGCSYNPSLTVSFPWGISYTAWPTCGSRNQAEHDSSYGSSSYFTQYNSGSPTAFGNYTAYSPNYSPPCYGVYVDAIAYEGNISDSYSSGAQEVCL